MEHKRGFGMSVRGLAVCVLAMVLVFGVNGRAPAQTKRLIKINMSSWKFEPDIIKFNEGDAVVLQLVNVDSQRPHNISSAFLNTVNFTVRGDAAQGTTPEGLKLVQVEPGKTGEVEFVAKGRGQVGFICSVFDHATRGMTGAMIIWPAGYHTGQ